MKMELKIEIGINFGMEISMIHIQLAIFQSVHWQQY